VVGQQLLPFEPAVTEIQVCEIAISILGIAGFYCTDFFDYLLVQRDDLQKHLVDNEFAYLFSKIPVQT